MLRTFTLIGVISTVATVAAPAVAAPESWAIHARAIGYLSDDDSETVTDTGTGVGVGNSFGLGFGAVFKPLPQWGLQLDLEWVPLDLVTVGGNVPDLRVGSVDAMSARLSLQYRFVTRGAIHPYLGVGTTYSTYGGYSLTDDMRDAGIGDVTFSNSLRVCTQAGADVDIGKGWLATVDVVYAPATTRLEFLLPDGGRFDSIALQANALLVSVGVGYSF